MRIHEPAITLLLDGEQVISQRRNSPSLRIVVLRRPGNESKIIRGTVVRVHKPAIALLSHRILAVFIWTTEAIQNPSLSVVILRRSCDQPKILARVFMRIHKTPVALLLDRKDASDGYQNPLLGTVVLRRARDDREVSPGVFMRVYEPVITLLLDGVESGLQGQGN